MANIKLTHLMRRSIRLTDRQRALVVGTLLGDGCLVETFSKNNLRLQIEQCAAQRDYVWWKYSILQSLVLTPPMYQSRTDSWRFRTISHPDLTVIGDLFYRGRRKVVPDHIEDLLQDPLSLAVWFMDDGAKNRNDGLILNTQCFSKKETMRLKDFLHSNFGLHAVSIQRDKNGWRLYVQKASATRLTELVQPFVLPALAYKLISPVETTRRPPQYCGVKI